MKQSASTDGSGESGGPPILDEGTLSNLRMLAEATGDSEFLASLISTFNDQAPERWDAITVSVQAGDAIQVKRAAHALKGSSGSVGALVLSNACKALEKAGHEGDLSSADAMAAKIRAELNRACAALAIEARLPAPETI